MKKRGPHILLIALSLILMFLVGTRYGRQLEVSDVALQDAIKKLPTIEPLPTDRMKENISFKRFISNTCSFSIVLPEETIAEKTSSYSGVLRIAEQEEISFSCDPKIVLDFWDKINLASQSADFSSNQWTIFDDESEDVSYAFLETELQIVYFKTNSRLIPLLTDSLFVLR